jgi:photosynthetic reaction center cytochrome c subunit
MGMIWTEHGAAAPSLHPDAVVRYGPQGATTDRRRRPSGRDAAGSRWWRIGSLALLAVCLVLPACDQPESVQRGLRGTSMLQVYDPDRLAQVQADNVIPEPEPVDEPDPEGPAISEVFENVQVLNDLTVLEFSRLMQAMSTWIAPEEGCEYCHNPNNLASDEKYGKVVARRMLEMTRDINTNWQTHVAGTGVTCWTCHRGQPVPSGDWFRHPSEGLPASALIGERAGQNKAGVATVVNSSLPYDPLSVYLNTEEPDIRVQGTRPLAGENRRSVKQAETTYSLMLYMSDSLGVNCTYCHNTRALASWQESTPQRATAWYGIRMVRKLNVDYLNPIAPLLPAHRLSPEGDGPKVACQTCHKGTYKPLLGVSMLGDYPELAGLMTDERRPPWPPEESAAAPVEPVNVVLAPGPAAPGAAPAR